MEELSLSDLLQYAKEAGHNPCFLLHQGHEVNLIIQAVGEGWVLGFILGQGTRAVVLRHQAIAHMSGVEIPGPQLERRQRPRPGLMLLLTNLAALHPEVVVRGAEGISRGKLHQVGRDWFSLRLVTGNERLIPFVAMDWLEAL